MTFPGTATGTDPLHTHLEEEQQDASFDFNLQFLREIMKRASTLVMNGSGVCDSFFFPAVNEGHVKLITVALDWQFEGVLGTVFIYFLQPPKASIDSSASACIASTLKPSMTRRAQAGSSCSIRYIFPLLLSI
jgi:hypothetical protein